MVPQTHKVSHRFVPLVFIFLLIGVQSFAQSYCGMVDNGSTVLIPANFSSMSLPGLGSSYTEPFGSPACTIYQASSAAALGHNIVHNYSTNNPFNADDSLLSVFTLSGAALILFNPGYVWGTVNTSGTSVTLASGTSFSTAMAGTLVVNGTGYAISSCSSTTACTLTTSAGTQSGVNYGRAGVVVQSANMPSSTTYTSVWDTSNPASFYYGNGAAVMKGQVGGTNCSDSAGWAGAPNCTVSAATLYSSSYNTLQFNENDISYDGLHFWIADQGQDCGCTTHVLLMTLNQVDATSATLTTTVTLNGSAGVNDNLGYHKLGILPNNYLFVNSSQTTTQDSIYNTSGSLALATNTAGGHVDFGYDSSNDPLGIAHWYQPNYGSGAGENPCINSYGAGTLMLNPSSSSYNKVLTCFTEITGTQIGVGQVTDNHWSWRDTSAGWIVMETTAMTRGCPTANADPSCLNWTNSAPASCNGTPAEGCWDHLEDEVLAIPYNFSEVLRLAHHRSRVNGNGNGYWSQPRPAISRDAKYVAFDSNFDQNTTYDGDTTDGTMNVFVIQFQLGSDPPPINPPTNLTAIVN